MACVNKNSPEFKKLLEQTNNDVFLAEFIYNQTYSKLNESTLKEESLDLNQTIKRAEDKLDFSSVTENWNYKNTDSVSVINNFTLDQLIKNDGVIEGSENQEKFNQLVNSIGELEAYRDYFENQKVIRPSKVVLKKLSARIDKDQESLYRDDSLFNESPMSEASELKYAVDNMTKIIENNNEESALKLAEALSKKLNIPYEIISNEKMSEMFPDQPFRQNFYRGGKVYLVEGSLNASSVFHEFAHPIIKSIAKDNPKLLNSLFEELINTPLGETIIANLSNDSYYLEGSNEFKEEAIVMALQSINDEKNITEDSKIKNFIKQLFFQIKQWLRGRFGKKINVSKLNSKTSLSQFVDMINYGKEFILDKQFLDADLFAMFETDYNAVKEDMKTGARSTTQNIMNSYYKLVKDQLTMFKSDNDIFRLLEEDLADENREGLLQQIEAIMQGIASLGNRRPVKPLDKLEIEGDNKLEKDIRDFDSRLTGFVEALAMGEQIMDKFLEKLEAIEKAGIEKMSENADALFAINLYNDEWYKQITEYRQTFIENYSLLPNSPIHTLMLTLETKVLTNRARSKNMTHDYIVDVLYDELSEQMEPIKKDFLDQLEAHKKSGNMSMYDKLHTEYFGVTVEEQYELTKLEDRSKNVTLELEEQTRLNFLKLKSYNAHNISKEQLKMMMRGELSDAQVLSSLMEAFMQSQDKITSTFAIFLQKTFNTINGNANSRRSELYKDLGPLMKAAGYMKAGNRFLGEGKMGDNLGTKSTTRKYNERTGKVEDFLEWQFKYNFYNFDADVAKLQEKMQEAKSKYDFNPIKENEDAWVAAEKEYEQFQLDYMHRDNLPIFYETRNKYLSDELGLEAKEAENEILDRMRVMQDNLNSELLKKSPEMEKLWQEYYQLSNIYDIYGEKKIGKPLQIAERLTEFRDAMQPFYEWTEREGQFEDELAKFVMGVEAEVGSPEFIEELKNWLFENTQVSVTDDYYETRSELIGQRSVQTEKLDEFNKEFGGTDVAPVYEELYAIIKNTRDDFNIYDGNKLTKEAQQKINDIHEKIVKIKDRWISKFGITKQELREYRDIEERLQRGEIVSDEELSYYENFWTLAVYTNAQEFGISEGELMAIDVLNKKINALSVSGLTPSYITTFTQFATANLEISEAFHSMNKSSDILAGELPNPVELFELAQDTDKMSELFKLSSEFKEWFLRNHYTEMRDEFDGTDGSFVGEFLRFRQTAVWQYSQPKDLKYYNARPMLQGPFKLDEEAKVGFLKEFTQNGYIAINGIPRVPTRKYSVRSVKSEFKTEIIERDFVDDKGNLILATQDNRGNWLPRDYNPALENSAKSNTYIDASYKQMFNEDKAKFNLLDYLKNNHLNNQEGLSAPQKMYLAYPRYRKGRIEQFDRDFFRMKWLRFKDTFRVAADDFEDGLNMNAAEPGTNQYRTLTRPIAGNYLLPIQDVSTNIISIMMDHAYSIEQYKGMRKVNSTANLLKDALISQSPQENIEYGILKRSRDAARNASTITSSQASAMRIQNVIAMIDTHLKGIRMKTIRVDQEGKPIRSASNFNAFIMKFVGIGAKRMAFMSFALDPVKSLRNYFGAKLMIIKKSVEGRWYTPTDLILTYPTSVKIMAEIIAKQFSNEVPSAALQFLDITGAIPSGLKKDIGGRFGRNIGQSLREGGFWYADRRYLNDSTVLHQFLAMLEHAKFELNGKTVSLIKAVELRDGKIYSKAGVPKNMSITYNSKGEVELGSKLQDIMNAHQSYLQKNVGVASEYNEPEAYRWILGKFTLFLMKFFPGMSVDKYQIRTSRAFRQGSKLGQKRINLGTKQAEVGTYVSIMKLIEELYNGTYNPKNLAWQTRTGIIQIILAYVIQKAIKSLYMGITLSTDDDDEPVSYYDLTHQRDVNGDRMYAQSYIDHTTAPLQSPLLSPKYQSQVSQIPGTDSYTGGQDFRLEQWLKLQGIALLQGIENEERTFNPWQAAVTAKDISLQRSPMADGGILKELYNLGNQVRDLASNDLERREKAINKKETGPFFWQEEEDWKGWTTIGKILGFKGNIVYPQQQIKAQQRYFED
tara:strand:+ start:23888 stop:30061 length:6174 start_codon:yes stop_codon:yes gene_type:complete